MKKKLISVLAGVLMLAGCGEKEEPTVHWSHTACVQSIAEEKDLGDYIYTVKEIKTNYERGDDEVYCFDITIKSGRYEKRFMCYAVVDDGEVIFVDCDPWID